jgi:serine/threonine protein kinase
MKKNYTNIKYKRSKRNKRKTVKGQKRKKTYKNGGSTIYYMDEDKIIKTDEVTRDGKTFFRKMYSKDKGKNDVRHIEKQLVEFLMRNPHPNIVTFYDVNNEYLDMEELNTKINYGDPEIVDIMREVKEFLQNLGIMYIDWKFDNIGKSKDGNYKLFDFDASGIINLDTNEWIVTPPNFWSFRNAIEKKCNTPKKIDDWSFEYNILRNENVICD